MNHNRAEDRADGVSLVDTPYQYERKRDSGTRDNRNPADRHLWESLVCANDQCEEAQFDNEQEQEDIGITLGQAVVEND